jgi:hypothetical protein
MQGYKTLIFGALVTALGAIQATDLATIVPEAWIGVVMGAIGVAVMVLRAMTTTPVGQAKA